MERTANLYITPESRHVGEIKECLSNQGVDIKVYDIHSDVDAHRRMLEATRGAGGPPVTEIGHQVVIGHDCNKLEETIDYEFR